MIAIKETGKKKKSALDEKSFVLCHNRLAEKVKSRNRGREVKDE